MHASDGCTIRYVLQEQYVRGAAMTGGGWTTLLSCCYVRPTVGGDDSLIISINNTVITDNINPCLVEARIIIACSALALHIQLHLTPSARPVCKPRNSRNNCNSLYPNCSVDLLDLYIYIPSSERSRTLYWLQEPAACSHLAIPMHAFFPVY